MFVLNIVENARNTGDKEGQMIVAEENDACYDDGEFQESE